MVQSGGSAEFDAFGKRTLLAGTQTLLRGLTILELIGSGVANVKGLSDALKVPRSTITRMLHNLVTEGYLYHIPEKGYFLGPRLVNLGDRAREQRPLVGVARPFLEALSDQVLDTIHLGAPTNEGTMIYLDKINGSRGFQMRSRIGLTVPMAFTGLGKAVLMTMSESEWSNFYSFAANHPRLQNSGPDLKSYEQFCADLLLSRERGYTFDDEENEIGIRCIAAPVYAEGASAYAEGERAVAAISISSTLNFMPSERINLLGPVIMRCAQKISRELGWSNMK
nr:IclR family transcriptional regulator [uncultured Cohaesibacter sp.]